MKKEVAQKWVEALRSGEYQQSMKALKTVEASAESRTGYCCLGVLCDLSRVGSWRSTKSPELAAYQTGNEINDYQNISWPPPEVLNWAGMRHNTGFIDSQGYSLSNMNDDGATFEEIAALIERYWEEL
jgi:hypothetical protein